MILKSILKPILRNILRSPTVGEAGGGGSPPTPSNYVTSGGVLVTSGGVQVTSGS